VFASDEVVRCTTCGGTACGAHAGVCVEDGSQHCVSHLAPLKDRPGALGCESHRSICHVDGAAFSVGGTMVCPVCTRRACASHTSACSSCGRSVCAAELNRASGRCATCGRLADTQEPADDLIAAAIDANKGEPPTAKGWRVARDATHVVAEVSHGWMRRTVFTVRHGDTKAVTVMVHSPFGSARRR
jgi:hypothetical protein